MATVQINNMIDGEVLPDSELIYSFDQISTALDHLAERLNLSMAGSKPVILCVMNGSVVFTGQLLPRLSFACELDYIHATRYRNTTQGDKLEWLSYPKLSLKDRAVLVLDDILDEGVTLDEIEKYCYAEGATRVETAVLLHKQHDRNNTNIICENIALVVEDKYVFGFGMDYEGQYRHLNAIYALKEQK